MNRLITISISHYCEKARWALDVSNIPYLETPHLPLVHRLYTGLLGGGSVPLLAVDGERYPNSSDILQYCLGKGGGERHTSPAQLREALAWERYFDAHLGVHSRLWAYAQLLPHLETLLPAMTFNVPARERYFARPILYAVRPMIRAGYNVTAEQAERSFARILSVFERVDRALSDGRAFLLGGHFSFADLTFAALASPVLIPANFGGSIPAFEDLPAGMQERVRQLRGTRAGAFALNLYRVHRKRPGLM